MMFVGSQNRDVSFPVVDVAGRALRRSIGCCGSGTSGKHKLEQRNVG